MSNCGSTKKSTDISVEKEPYLGIEFIKNTTLSELMARAEEEDKIIFLDFYADWCGPCKVMDHEVFNLKEIGDFFNENFINIKVDGESGGGPDLANMYDIKGYPTVIFIDSNGVVLKSQVGLIFEDQLMSLAIQAIDLKKMSS